MQRLATPALFLGLVGLAVGVGLRLYRPLSTTAWAAALIAGGLLIVLAMIASLSGYRDLWGRRATRYGLNSLVMIVLMLGVVVLVEAVSLRHNWRADLTENRRYSLAPQTIKLLKELKVPVKAALFFRSDQPKRTAEELLRQYSARSEGKFTWEFIDLDRNPMAAVQYGVEAYNTVILTATPPGGKPKQEKITSTEEEALTNALIRVTREGKRTIYFVKGHGEKELAGSEPGGLNQLKTEIEKLNYETKELVLARESKLPADAAIVVVAGAQKDLLPTEVDALASYIGSAGKVLFMIDPIQAPGIGALLERYGLGLGNDMIMDVSPLSRLNNFGPAAPIVVEYPQHPITRGFRAITIFPESRTVTTKEKAPEGATVQALARTSSQSWAERNLEAVRRGETKPDPEDPVGPLTLAAVATVDARDVPDDRKGAKARLVVIGDSDFVTNRWLNFEANRDFLLNILSWLAEEENLIAIRPKENRPSPIFLTDRQALAFNFIPPLIPLVMIGVGVASWWRRRRL
jgi:ABC-type uncharacterized transport system involved in gliding motility auxiliary subunit